MRACNAKVSENKSRKFCIEITTPGRNYWVCADNAEEMHKWIIAIRSASLKLLEGMAPPPGSRVSAYASVSSPAVFSSLSPSSRASLNTNHSNYTSVNTNINVNNNINTNSNSNVNSTATTLPPSPRLLHVTFLS